MQALQQKQKFVISLGVVTVIALAGAAMTLSMLFLGPTWVNPSIGMPIWESTKQEIQVYPDESTVSEDIPVPGNTNPEGIVSNSPNLRMPGPGSIVPEMIVEPN